MAAKWEQQIVSFLRQAGDELKRAGEQIRTEAQRVVEEVRDPDTQQKIRESISNFGTWAKTTAEEAAGMIDTAVKKAETKISGVRGGKGKARPVAPRPAPAKPTGTSRPAQTQAKKTVGRKPAAKAAGAKAPARKAAKAPAKSKAKSGSSAKPGARKTVGKKKS